MSALPPKADMLSVSIDVCFVPIADINHHLLSAVVTGLIRLFQFGGTVEIRPSTPWHGLLQLLRLFDLPTGFVVGYKRRAARGDIAAATSPCSKQAARAALRGSQSLSAINSDSATLGQFYLVFVSAALEGVR